MNTTTAATTATRDKATAPSPTAPWCGIPANTSSTDRHYAVIDDARPGIVTIVIKPRHTVGFDHLTPGWESPTSMGEQAVTRWGFAPADGSTWQRHGTRTWRELRRTVIH